MKSHKWWLRLLSQLEKLPSSHLDLLESKDVEEIETGDRSDSRKMGRMPLFCLGTPVKTEKSPPCNHVCQMSWMLLTRKLQVFWSLESLAGLVGPERTVLEHVTLHKAHFRIYII